MSAPRTSSRLKKAQTKSEADLYRDVSRGFHTGRMMRDSYWTKYLQPLIESKKQGALIEKQWRPEAGLSKCEAIALGCVRQSGKYDGLEDLLKTLQGWVATGKKAKEKLSKMERGNQ